MDPLEGKVAVVTGGGRGIGEVSQPHWRGRVRQPSSSTGTATMRRRP